VSVDESIDLDLLAKLVRGEGGTRTGALMRAGYIRVEVTDEGRTALSRYADGLHFAGRLDDERVVRAALAGKEPTP